MKTQQLVVLLLVFVAGLFIWERFLRGQLIKNYEGPQFEAYPNQNL